MPPFRPATSGRTACVAREQRPPLGHVVGMVRLETPGVQADRDVIGQHVGAGEIEVDQPRQPVAEEEHIVGEQVGVNDAVRQILAASRASSGRARARRSRASRAATSSARCAAGCISCCQPATESAFSRRIGKSAPARCSRASASPRRRNGAPRAADPHALQEGDHRRRPPRELPRARRRAVLTGCGQVMPRLARCSISAEEERQVASAPASRRASG